MYIYIYSFVTTNCSVSELAKASIQVLRAYNVRRTCKPYNPCPDH